MVKSGYIGTTSHGINRIEEHESWIEEEYDNVVIRVGSVREFTGWEGWKKPINYPKPQKKLVALSSRDLIKMLSISTPVL